jgi:hypothetical protein
MFLYMSADRTATPHLETTQRSEPRVSEGKGTAVLKRFLAVLAASLAVAGASAGAALADYPPTTQTGAVSSTSITLGGHVTFAGSGFQAGSKVTIGVDSAMYATVVASGPASSALGGRTSMHFTTAAYAQPVAKAAASAAATFSVKVTLDQLGSHVLTGTGVAPDGSPAVVSAKVMVVPVAATVAVKASGSGLPFTGSAVIIPGVIVGAAMMAGGFLLLTTVRSRKAGART